MDAPLTPTQKRSRRRKRREGDWVQHRECQREGCYRGVPLSGGHVYCGALCRGVDRELSSAQRICDAVVQALQLPSCGWQL